MKNCSNTRGNEKVHPLQVFWYNVANNELPDGLFAKKRILKGKISRKYKIAVLSSCLASLGLLAYAVGHLIGFF